MTPKEKAEQLRDRFICYVQRYDDYVDDRSFYKAKECALIAVDELIKYHDDVMDVIRYELPSNIVAVIPYKYWEDVKQEIEKL
jgi:membrane-bound lytic murein transglycosylase MltF